MTASERGRAGRRAPLLAVDVVGALHVVGTLLAYLSLAVLVPTGVRDRLRRAGLAVPRRRRDHGRRSPRAVAYATRGDHRLGIREGFLVVALTWLAAAAFGALPYILSGDPQLDRPVDAFFEGMSGFSTTGGSVVARRRGAAAQPRDLAPVHPVARRDRDHRPRARRPAAPARRRPAAARARDARAGDRDAEHADPRHRPARLGALHRAHRRALRDPARRSASTGVDERMTPFQAFAHALTTIPTAGFSTQGRLDRELRGGDAVGDRRLHDPRRLQLRAHVPRARAAPAAGARRATARPGCTSALLALGSRRSSSPRSGPRTSSAAPTPSAPASSRPSRR